MRDVHDRVQRDNKEKIFAQNMQISKLEEELQRIMMTNDELT